MNRKGSSIYVAALFASLTLPLLASAQSETPANPAPQAPAANSAQTAPAVHSSTPMESHVGNLSGHSGAGRELYFRYCWGCHGFRGDGNGENAQWIDPKPRNFTQATFKCRSTVTGTLPTDQDLANSIKRGFENSNMPSWIPLTNQNRADLVAFIKTFSERWKNEKAGTPITIPPEPALTIAGIQHGHELFEKLECWKCHGQEGRGDGPSASTLTDSNDQPIRPYNFAAGSRFKCGTTNQDIYRIFITGVDGTPMPSFADVIKPEEAWDLVHYLRTLQVTSKSPELALWESSKEGAAIVAAQRLKGTPTGSGVNF